MDFKQLEAFVNVVELGSFSAAAKALYLSQPTVSAHIAALEKELSAVLVIRTTKEVYASPRGKILLEYAKKMLELREKADRAMKDESENMTLTVAAPDYLLRNIVQPALSVFREANPGVSVNLFSMSSRKAEREVQKGAVLLAVVNGKSGNKKLKYSLAASDSLSVATSVNIGQQNALDGVSEVFTDSAENAAGRDAAKYLKKNCPDVRITPLSSAEHAIEAARDGLGAAVVPSIALAGVDGVYAQPLAASARQQLHIVFARSFEIGKAAKQLIKQIKSACGDLAETNK